jgi:hypothetical protein
MAAGEQDSQFSAPRCGWLGRHDRGGAPPGLSQRADETGLRTIGSGHVSLEATEIYLAFLTPDEAEEARRGGVKHGAVAMVLRMMKRRERAS